MIVGMRFSLFLADDAVARRVFAFLIQGVRLLSLAKQLEGVFRPPYPSPAQQ